jgi:hypothetical protein
MNLKDVLAIILLTVTGLISAGSLALAIYAWPGVAVVGGGFFSVCFLCIVGIPWAIVRLQDRPRKSRRQGGTP